MKEPKFTVEGEKAWKLVDLQNLWVYFDQELLGDLDGRNILVSLSAALVVHVHGAGLHQDLTHIFIVGENIYRTMGGKTCSVF